MARFTNPTDMMDSLSAPLGDLISEVGRGVADAQAAMDSQTIARMKEIVAGGDQLVDALRSIGYQPTWYQIPEATAKLSIALSISGEAQSSVQGGGQAGGNGLARLRLNAAPVNADYSNKFNYQVQASSEIQFKIVPVPPSVAAEHLRAVPGVVGKTVLQAEQLLDSVGLQMSLVDPDSEPEDTAVITAQNPEAGEVINDDVPVALSFD